MKKKKSIVTTILFLCLMAVSSFTITSCGNNENKPSESISETQEIQSEVDMTYKHTNIDKDTEIIWASEEIKNKQLDEMEIDEETFLNGYKNSTIEIKFLPDNKSIVSYNLNGKGEIENLFYKKNEQVVLFFDSLDDMEADNQKVNNGIFAGQFIIASDYTSLSIISELKDMLKITLICNISKENQ